MEYTDSPPSGLCGIYTDKRDNGLKAVLNNMNRMSILQMKKKMGTNTRFIVESEWLDDVRSRAACVISGFNDTMAMLDFDQYLRNLTIAC